MKGFVYVLSNKSMPGIYKVGITSRTPQERASELSTSTGIPTKFIVEYFILTDDYDKIERFVHSRLSKLREGKEFFKCSLEKCTSEVRFRADSHYIYDEKFRTENLRKVVYDYESVNGITIDKNIKEHNIRIQKKREEEERLKRLEAQRKREEQIKREEEYRIKRERQEKFNIEFERKRKEEAERKKSEMRGFGIAVLVIGILCSIEFGSGVGSVIGFLIIWAIIFGSAFICSSLDLI